MKITACIGMLLSFSLLASSLTFAKDNPVLFRQFTYGMKPDQVNAIEKIGECEDEDEDLNGVLCARKKVTFLGSEWEEVFKFLSNSLATVILYMDNYEHEQYLKTLMALVNNDFALAIIEADGKIMYVPEVIKKHGKNASQILDDFERKALLKEAPYTVYFVPANFFKALLKNPEKSWTEVLLNAPSSLRVISLIHDPEFLSITFSLPALEAQMALKQGKNIKEKF